MRLSDIEKKQPYQAPRGYLESYTFSPPVLKVKKRHFGWAYALAAACSALIFVLVFDFNTNEQTTFEHLPGSFYSFELQVSNPVQLAFIDELEEMNLLPEIEEIID